LTDETKPGPLPVAPQGPSDSQTPPEVAPPPDAATLQTPASGEAPAAPSPAPAGLPGTAAQTDAAPAQDQEAVPASEVPHKEPDRPTAVIRYGAMGLVGRFAHSLDSCRCGQRVVIKSDRGMEIGAVVCSWEGCGAPTGVGPQIRGEVLRAVSHADEVEERHLADSGKREFQFCKQTIAAHKLPMKLAAVEHLFGGDRIIFYFVSESRVDFRALVRDLAHEFQTRIEMRQIGVRDEARLLGDYERCGRPLCCRAWIKELEPVSMKMAKIQKATLDPTKISGRCGRLMCCLRFEHATYRDLARNLPRKNTLVTTPRGPAKVLDSDVVSQIVAVLLQDGTRINFPAEDVKPYDGAAAAPRAEGAPEAAPETAEAESPDKAEEAEAGVPESRLAYAPEREARPSPPPGAPAAPEVLPPSGEGPSGEGPSGEGPSGERPSGEGPSGERPSGERPNGERRSRRGRRRRRGGRNRGGRPPQGGPGGGPQGASPSSPPSGAGNPSGTQGR
jgi:cell fate regulator YaaT (PSP1 superfamily)